MVQIVFSKMQVAEEYMKLETSSIMFLQYNVGDKI